MPIQNQTIDAAITVLKSISPIGGAKIETKLTGEERTWPAIAEYLEQITTRMPFYGGWISAARAWLLVQLCGVYWGGPGTGAAPTPIEMQTALAHANATTEGALREEIKDVIAGRAILKIFADRQNDPTRLAWSNAFTDPASHNPNAFLYLIHGMRPSVTLKVDSQAEPQRATYLKNSLKGYLDSRSTRTTDWKLLSASLYLSRPEVLQTEVLSCSIISEGHVRTYANAPFGFVLSVPSMNIASASERDLAASSIQNKARGDQLASARGDDRASIYFAKLLLVDDFVTNLVDGNYWPQLETPRAIVNKPRRPRITKS